MNPLLPTPLYSMYRLVCNSPDCGGIAIARMPQLIDQDFTTNTTSHTHAYYEILWFEEAGGVHTVDFEDYPIQANTLLFITPGQMHRFDGVTKHKGYSVILCTEFFERYRDATDFVRCSLFHSDLQQNGQHKQTDTGKDSHADAPEQICKIDGIFNGIS